MIAVLRRYAVVLIIATLLGTGAAAYYSWSRGDQYLATTRLFFTSSAVDVADVYQATMAGQQRVLTYRVLATDSKVLSNAATRAGESGDTARNLASSVHVDVPPGTIIMDIGVDNTNPVVAAKLANGIAEELIATVDQLERPLGGGPPPVTLTVVQRAIPTSAPVAKVDPIYTAAGAVLGFLVGSAIAFGLEMSRRRRRNPHPAEMRGDPRGAPEVDNRAETVAIAEAPGSRD